MHHIIEISQVTLNLHCVHCPSFFLALPILHCALNILHAPFPCRMRVQTATESPFGLGYQGSNDPVYSNLRRMQQTPTNSSSSAADAYMRRSNGLRGWFPAEYTAPSLVEQTGNSFSWSVNLNSNLSEAATHSHHHVQERNAVEPLQLFPEDTGSLLPDNNE